MSTSSLPPSPRLTAVEQPKASRCRDERRTRRKARVWLSAHFSRTQKPEMSASSLLGPTTPVALEGSAEQCGTSITLHDQENAPATQPECPICCTEFDSNQNLQHKSYSCPNDACTVDFCETCKQSPLEHDYRCPFCRCELDGATLTRSTWNNDEMDEADVLAAAGNNMDELLLHLEVDIVLDLIRDQVI